MSAVEKKVEEFRNNLLRMNEIKKQLIDCEISWVSVIRSLELSQYEYKKLLNGELKEREHEVIEIIKKTPEHIKKRDRIAKTFQKILIDRELTIRKFCKENKLDVNKVYRVLRRLDAERDLKVEQKIEKALNCKIF